LGKPRLSNSALTPFKTTPRSLPPGAEPTSNGRPPGRIDFGGNNEETSFVDIGDFPVGREYGLRTGSVSVLRHAKQLPGPERDADAATAAANVSVNFHTV